MFPFPDEHFLVLVFLCSVNILVCSYTSFMLTHFLSMSFFYFSIIYTFPDSLFLVDLALFTDTLYFFWALFNYFFFCFSFTFEMEPYLAISPLLPCFNVFVTLNAVFTFYVLLLFLNMIVLFSL